jgi:hypothetical protein
VLTAFVTGGHRAAISVLQLLFGFVVSLGWLVRAFLRDRSMPSLVMAALVAGTSCIAVFTPIGNDLGIYARFL